MHADARNRLGGEVIGHRAIPDGVDRLERAIGSNTVESIAHGAAQLVVGREACNAERRGRLESTVVGDLAHQACKIAASRGVADHVIDLAGLERLKALVDVGKRLLVGRDALFGECFLRGRGSLDAQGGGVKRFGGNAQRLAVARLSEHGGSVIQASTERADVAVRGIDVANEDIGLFVAERGIGRGRIDEGDLEAHAACKGAGGVDCVAREVAIGALHGLRGIGSVEGDRQGTGGDQGIVRHRRRDGVVLDLVNRGGREGGQRVERAPAQAQYGDDRRGPSA